MNNQFNIKKNIASNDENSGSPPSKPLDIKIPKWPIEGNVKGCSINVNTEEATDKVDKDGSSIEAVTTYTFITQKLNWGDITDTKEEEDIVNVTDSLNSLTTHTSTTQKPERCDNSDQEEHEQYIQPLESGWRQQESYSNGGSRYRTSRYNQRPKYDGLCSNIGCSNETDLRYCSECYNNYQSRMKKCANDGCMLLTVARYCRDCRILYRRSNHYCEACKVVLTDRKWCNICFAGFRLCMVSGCLKKVQPRFTHCWEHFQSQFIE